MNKPGSSGEANPLNVLMLYMEPASYIVDLVGVLRQQCADRLAVFYLSRGSTQAWSSGDAVQVLEGPAMSQISLLRQQLRDGNYDVLHLCGWGHPVLLAGLLLAALHRIPVVVETDTPLPGEKRILRDLVKKLLYPILFRIPAMFLPGGTPQSDYLRHYGVAKERLRIARMTVDVASLIQVAETAAPDHREQTRAVLNVPADHFMVLYVGRLEPHKGLHDLVAALRSSELSTLEDLSCVVVGDGSLRDEMQSAQEVLVQGRLEGASLHAAYLAADLLVLPSHFEPWGLVVNEAMALGVPVLVSSAVGCGPDLLDGGDNGWSFEAGNVVELGRAIRYCFEHPDERRLCAANARRFIADWTLENESVEIQGAWRQAVK